MTQHFPVVVEQESNGTFSAWVAGLPGVSAAADTAAVAKRAIRGALAAHLDALRRSATTPKRRPRSSCCGTTPVPRRGARRCGLWAWVH